MGDIQELRDLNVSRLIVIAHYGIYGSPSSYSSTLATVLTAVTRPIGAAGS